MHSDDFDEWARKPRPLPAAGGGSGFAEEREERRAATQGRYLRSEAWAFGTQCRAHMLSRRRYRPDRGASGGVTVCPEGVLSGRSLLRRRVALEACCSTDGILACPGGGQIRDRRRGRKKGAALRRRSGAIGAYLGDA